MSFRISSEIGLLGESHFANVPFKGEGEGLESSAHADAGAKIEFIPIHFKNVPVISFIAYMGGIKDTISQAVNSTQPYGRPDPIRVWKSSDRKITLAIDILSSSQEMALRNLNNINWLLASSYPTYDASVCGCSSAVAASPMYRVKYANLITNVDNKHGLLCVIPSFSVNHDFKSGVILVRPGVNSTDKGLLRDAGFPTQSDNYVIATKISLSCTLEVVHEHSLGWDLQTGEWRGKKSSGYPYGLGLVKSTSDPPSGASGGSTDQGGKFTQAEWTSLQKEQDAQDAAETNPGNREAAASVDKHLGG